MNLTPEEKFNQEVWWVLQLEMGSATFFSLLGHQLAIHLIVSFVYHSPVLFSINYRLLPIFCFVY